MTSQKVLATGAPDDGGGGKSEPQDAPADQTYAGAVMHQDSNVDDWLDWSPAYLGEWEKIPVPEVSLDKVILPVLDDSWGSFKKLLMQAVDVWKINHTLGSSAGPLKNQYFSADTKMDAQKTADVQYIAGYMEAVKSRLMPKSIEQQAMPFRHGFADAIPLLIKHAAIDYEVMTSEEARIMLREPKRGENNPLIGRLASLMSSPGNVGSVVRAIEIILSKIAKKISVDALRKYLDEVCCNRRAAVQKFYPNLTREVEIKVPGKKNKTEKIKKTMPVMPSIAQSYKTLASVEEQALITQWNEFSRSENIPTCDREGWQVEFLAARSIARGLMDCATAIRRELKSRKQHAYESLPDAVKKDKEEAKKSLPAAILEALKTAPQTHLRDIIIPCIGGNFSMHNYVSRALANARNGIADRPEGRSDNDSTPPTPVEG